MKLKDFLKSGSFKCILVLFLIALICGSILAVANDLFYVSDEEMFARSMAKIDESIDASTLVQKTDAAGKSYTINSAEGVIEDVRVTADGKTYLVQSKGNKCGYSGGSVTLWVSISTDEGSVTAINKVVLDSYDSSQSLIGQITDEYLSDYSSGEYSATVTGTGYFTIKKDSSVTTAATGSPVISEKVASGASYTSNAVNAAVNAALEYVREEVKKA